MPVVSFLIFVVVGSFTPGPNTIMAMNSGRLRGFRKSRPLLAGMAFGLMLVLLLSALCNLYLTRIMPAVRPFLGVAGGAYMLFLALKPFLGSPGGKSSKASSGGTSFLTGVLLQFVNPKVLFFALALMASFILPYDPSPGSVVAFTLGIGAVGYASVCCWAAFGALFLRFFSSRGRLLDAVMAILLVYCAWSVAGATLLESFGSS